MGLAAPAATDHRVRNKRTAVFTCIWLLDAAGTPRPDRFFNQTRSKRSAFMTLFQAATKSLTNFALASDWP